MHSNHEAKKGIESRRSPRRVFNRAIGVLFAGRFSIQQALQLSEGGMMFISETPHARGEQIVATIVMPGGDSIVVRGEILYQRPGPSGSAQYGVRFDNVPLHCKRMIRNYVSAKTQAEAEVESGSRDDVGWDH